MQQQNHRSLFASVSRWIFGIVRLKREDRGAKEFILVWSGLAVCERASVKCSFVLIIVIQYKSFFLLEWRLVFGFLIIAMKAPAKFVFCGPVLWNIVVCWLLFHVVHSLFFGYVRVRANVSGDQKEILFMWEGSSLRGPRKLLCIIKSICHCGGIYFWLESIHKWSIIEVLCFPSSLGECENCCKI